MSGLSEDEHRQLKRAETEAKAAEKQRLEDEVEKKKKKEERRKFHEEQKLKAEENARKRKELAEQHDREAEELRQLQLDRASAAEAQRLVDEAAARKKEEEEKKRAAAELKERQETERKAAAAKEAAKKEKAKLEAQRLAAAAKDAEQRRVAASIASGAMSVTQMSDGRLVATGGAGNEEVHLENSDLEAVHRVAKDVKVTVQTPVKKAPKKKKSLAQGGTPKESPAAAAAAAPAETFTLNLKSVVSKTPSKKSSAANAPAQQAAPEQQGWKKKTVAVQSTLISTAEIQASQKSGLANIAKRLKDNKQKHGAVLDIIGALVKLISEGGPTAIEKELATGKQAQALNGSVKLLVAILKESPGHIGVLVALGLLKFGSTSARIAQDVSGMIPESFDNYAGSILGSKAFFEVAELNKQPPQLDDDGDPIEQEEPDGLPADQLHVDDSSVIVVRRVKRGRAAQAQIKYLMTSFAGSKAVKISDDMAERTMARMRTHGDTFDKALLVHQKAAADAASAFAATEAAFEQGEEAAEVNAAKEELESLKAKLAELMAQQNDMNAEAAQLKEKVFRTDARLPSVKTELAKTKQQKDEIKKFLKDTQEDIGVGKWLEDTEKEDPTIFPAGEDDTDEAEEDIAPKKEKRGSFLRRAKKSTSAAALVVSEKEEAKRLSNVVTRIGSQANVTNDGKDVDPERDIGHIGSSYKPTEVVPEWMKKRNT